MSAATREKLATYSPLEVPTSTQLEHIDTTAAGGVARVDSASGYRCMTLACCGCSATYSVTFATKILTSGVLRFNTNKAHLLCYPFDLPQAHTLDKVKAIFLPASHVSGAPASQPKLRLYRVATSATLLASVAAAATAGSYDGATKLTIEATGTSTIVQNSGRYQVTFENESGANAALGLRVLSIQAYVTLDTASGASKPGIKFWV